MSLHAVPSTPPTALATMVEVDLLTKAPLTDLGGRIRSARLARSLSQAQLATPAGVTGPYLSRIEAGQRRPSVEVLVSFAKTLSLSVRDLVVGFEDTDQPGKELIDYLGQLAASATAAWLANPSEPEAYQRMTLAVAEWEHATTQAPTPPPVDVDQPSAALLEHMTAAVLAPARASGYGTGQQAWDDALADLTLALPVIQAAIAAARDDARAALRRAMAAFDGDSAAVEEDDR